jgi:hypothetical protein
MVVETSHIICQWCKTFKLPVQRYCTHDLWTTSYFYLVMFYFQNLIVSLLPTVFLIWWNVECLSTTHRPVMIQLRYCMHIWAYLCSMLHSICLKWSEHNSLPLLMYLLTYMHDLSTILSILPLLYIYDLSTTHEPIWLTWYIACMIWGPPKYLCLLVLMQSVLRFGQIWAQLINLRDLHIGSYATCYFISHKCLLLLTVCAC